MKSSTSEEKFYFRRYRKYRNLAGRIYDLMGEDAPEDREDYMIAAVNCLERNNDNNREFLQDENISRISGGYL